MSAPDDKRIVSPLRSFLVILALIMIPLSAQAATSPSKMVVNAMGVLQELRSAPDAGIPDALLSRCYGIAIFPSLYKGGLFVGVSYGKGILMIRNKRDCNWRGPLFLTIKGGSLGWQIGVKATDLVLVITNKRGIDSFLKNNLTLGGDIGVAAGPVGRKAGIGTDAALHAELYSYSRSKGLFAGISLEGCYVSQDYEADRIFYHKCLTPQQILYGGITVPASVQNLKALLKRCCCR